MKDPYIMPDSFKDPFSFEEVLSGENNFIRGNLILDFCNISFVEPYSVVSLLLLGRNYIRNSGSKIRIINIPVHIFQYLRRIDFFNKRIFDIDEGLYPGDKYKRSALSRSLVEITDIPNKERESIGAISGIIRLFRERGGHILKYWLNSSIVDCFVTVISEVCQNIFEHSLDSGYFMIQTYSYGNDNIFRLVISDSGIGIQASFGKKPEIKYETPAHLIQKALTTPISSKRLSGYGLCRVNNIIQELEGSIFIRSGSSSLMAIYSKKPGKPYMFIKNDLSHFNGTQFSISLTMKR